MSLDIKKSCSFQKLISLTTVVRPGCWYLKSEDAALNWYWCCRLVFCSDASPSTDPPITESVVLRHSGCRLFSSYNSCRYISESHNKMTNVVKPKKLDMNPNYFVTKSEINKKKLCRTRHLPLEAAGSYLATSSQGGRGWEQGIHPNLKVIAVPVLATILNYLKMIKKKNGNF